MLPDLSGLWPLKFNLVWTWAVSSPTKRAISPTFPLIFRVLKVQRGKGIQNSKRKQPIKKIQIILFSRKFWFFFNFFNHPVAPQIYSLTKHTWNCTYKHWYNTLQHCIVGFLAKSSVQFLPFLFKPLWNFLRALYSIYTIYILYIHHMYFTPRIRILKAAIINICYINNGSHDYL